LTPEEGEDLIRDFMRENNVILFIKEEFEENDLENCDGKIIGTNVSQGAVMTTGDTLVFVISNLKEDS
jgi:beta-lactam-binding protein with PASTA domain